VPPRPPRPSRRRQPKLLLRDYVSPDQAALQIITNAIHAALEYSPLKAAPQKPHDDIYAYVAREIQDRFWPDIYVERPEVRQILFTLETGRVALITGERGTGKSTAIQAVVQELDHPDLWPHATEGNQAPPGFIPYVFDASVFTEDLHDEKSVSEVIHNEIYKVLNSRLTDRDAWTSYRHANHDAYELFRLAALDDDGHEPLTPQDWRYLATQKEYAPLITAGNTKFAHASHGDRLRTLLEFMAKHTTDEPLIVIDNIDHLGNGLARHCGVVLSAIMSSSTKHRIRGAIAVRPESADAIQHVLDTGTRATRIPMLQHTVSLSKYDEPPVNVTLSVLRKRIMVLREPQIRERIIKAVDPEQASRLAESAGMAQDGVDSFLGSILELLDLVVFDIFSPEDDKSIPGPDDWEFVSAIHFWHNGSLRECAFSLTMFASDILQNKAYTYRLLDLLQLFTDPRQQLNRPSRGKVTRLTRSLLYRHLLFWTAPPDALRPHQNVMVFDGTEEKTDPPIHFLRLRLLQYLGHREKGNAKVGKIRSDFGKLDIDRERIDEALCDLAIKRSQNDGGLVRIDGLPDVQTDSNLDKEAAVQLLDAGKFLIDRLYVTTEYLFWSAITISNANPNVQLPTRIVPENIQSDEFRVSIAASFLEEHLVEKFYDEHPYLLGFTHDWPPQLARDRLNRYKRYFGFSEQDWFLDRAAGSLSRFMPPGDRSPGFVKARTSIAKVRELARSLDLAVKRTS
jgi:energy-coupling factor transporter ATP-binding protein EcfA2